MKRRFAMTRMWPVWTIFTIVGMIVGFWLSSAFESFTFTWALARLDPIPVYWLASIAFGLGYGVALGTSQGLFYYYLDGLRLAAKWGLLTCLGVTLGMLVLSLDDIYAIPGRELILRLMPGAALGVGQWISLRKQVRHSWIWIVVIAVSWPLMSQISVRMRGFSSLVISAAVFGALTGLAWSLLFTQSDELATPDSTPSP